MTFTTVQIGLLCFLWACLVSVIAGICGIFVGRTLERMAWNSLIRDGKLPMPPLKVRK